MKRLKISTALVAAISLVTSLMVGTIAPASAAVNNLSVAKGLTAGVQGYTWDSAGPDLISWSFDDSYEWNLVSVPVGSVMDKGDFTSNDELGQAYIGLAWDEGFWINDEDMESWTRSRVTDTRWQSCIEVDGDGQSFTLENCYLQRYVRPDLTEFDRPGNYVFEVRSGNKISIVTIVVGNDQVATVELSVDRTQVADDAGIQFFIKSYDGAGRLTNGLNYNFYDYLQEFVNDYSWNITVDEGQQWDYFSFELGAQVVGFDVDEDFEWNNLPINLTFEAVIQGIQSNTVTVRVGESADVSHGVEFNVVEIDGKVVDLREFDKEAGVLKSQRTVSFTFNTNSSNNAGKYVFVEAYNFDDGSINDSDLALSHSGWQKLDAAGNLSVSVTNKENIIDSLDNFYFDIYNDSGYYTYFVKYYGAGETAVVDLVNAGEFVDYHENGSSDFIREDNDVEFYKSLTPGQSVDVKVEVTDIFGNVMANHPVYVEENANDFGEDEDADIRWTEDAEFAEFAEEVETDANGFATISLKNTNSAAMTQIELWEGFRIRTYGNDLVNEETWTDMIEVYIQVVRSLEVTELVTDFDNVILNDNDVDETSYNNSNFEIAIDDRDGTSDSSFNDNVEIDWEVLNSDSVGIWGVPVTLSAPGGFVSNDTADSNEKDIVNLTPNSLTVPSYGEGMVEAVFMTQKSGPVTFTLSAGNKTVSATQTYIVEGSHVARFVAAVNSTVAVSYGGVTTLEFKVTDRFGNAVPETWLYTTFGTGNPVLGGGIFLIDGHAETDGSGIARVDVWTAGTPLNQIITTVTAYMEDQSAASHACEADFVYDFHNVVDSDCIELADGYTVSAAVGTASTAISYTVAPVASDVKALKNAFSVTVDNAKGKVVRVYVGSVLKGMFVAKSDSAIRRYAVKAGKKVVTVKVETYSRAETVKVRK